MVPVAVTLSAVLAVAAARAEPPSAGVRHGSDWPSYLGPSGDGRSPETGLALEWGAAGPPVLWNVSAGEGYAAPSLASGRLLFFDRFGDRARLTCRDAATGDEIWRSEYETSYEDLYDFSGGPRASPVVDGELVYTYGVEGRLRCQRVADGELVWDVDTFARFGVVQNFFGVGSTPVVEGELLIAMVGGSPKESPRIHSGEVKPNGTGLVAFDKKTGEVRWTSVDELASYSSPVIRTVAGRRRGFALLRGGLVGFDPGSGDVGFHFPWRAKRLETVNAANPVVIGDRVLIAESYGPGGVLLQLGKAGPEVVWKDGRRDQSLSLHWMTPIVRDGHIYASSGQKSASAELRAIDLETGEVKWREPGLRRSTLIYADGHLIVLTEQGRLLAVRATPKRYQVVADSTPKRPDGTTWLKQPVWNAPVLAHGLLYARGKDRLVCFDLRPVE